MHICLLEKAQTQDRTCGLPLAWLCDPRRGLVLLILILTLDLRLAADVVDLCHRLGQHPGLLLLLLLLGGRLGAAHAQQSQYVVVAGDLLRLLQRHRRRCRRAHWALWGPLLRAIAAGRARLEPGRLERRSC